MDDVYTIGLALFRVINLVWFAELLSTTFLSLVVPKGCDRVFPGSVCEYMYTSGPVPNRNNSGPVWGRELSTRTLTPTEPISRLDNTVRRPWLTRIGMLVQDMLTPSGNTSLSPNFHKCCYITFRGVTRRLHYRVVKAGVGDLPRSLLHETAVSNRSLNL